MDRVDDMDLVDDMDRVDDMGRVDDMDRVYMIILFCLEGTGCFWQ